MTLGHHNYELKDAREAFHEEMRHNKRKKIFIKWFFRFLVCLAILMALFIVYVTEIKQ
jgi:type IV secretory pathway component VirB8